ncbi:Outer membrane protein assembly factor BamB precursor [Symmachiella dynata]|uniref:outer membrane protein assembly factor BamB family protein n=1 Tax=Symmachiella dynata TaxID=2527995 RepID=UPI00118D54BC|nr:PQQ-binding-like beta-propeller repeat protein [Symmachiella dynata]QDT49509.1 Outer membrane protein assembly factor BamB precursor [Symmachiella dynata]
MFVKSTILGCLLSIALAGSLAAENWPGWRGPGRNGVSTESELPTEWSETAGIRWKTAVPGSGISNPIVWDDRVIVTASDGPQQADLHIICYATDDGRELWHQRLWGTAPTRYHANKSSMASPAAVTDGNHVFAFFGTGDVFCTDMQGQLQWQRSLANEYGQFENRFAASSSPLLYQDMVIVQCDHYGDSYVIALDQETGANRWKRDRPEAWLSWASPQLIPVGNGQHELIVAGSHKVDAFAPATGEPLWTVNGMSRECIPTPVFGDGSLYVVSGPKSPTMAIRPGGRGDVTETHVRWRNTRGAPFVPSAILVGERYYLVDDAGIATCLNAADGKRVWQKRLSGAFTASPVAGDQKIYFTNERGETTVIAAAKRGYKRLAQNSVGEPVFASPAISQGCIFLRTNRHLLCIDGRGSDDQ